MTRAAADVIGGYGVTAQPGHARINSGIVKSCVLSLPDVAPYLIYGDTGLTIRVFARMVRPAASDVFRI